MKNINSTVNEAELKSKTGYQKMAKGEKIVKGSNEHGWNSWDIPEK